MKVMMNGKRQENGTFEKTPSTDMKSDEVDARRLVEK